jgi:hypothetical protein
MVSRTVTYALDVLNLVANSQESATSPANKRSLGNVALNFADTPATYGGTLPVSLYRWEASAGVFFSTLPVRSFTAAPVYTNQVLTDHVVQESIRPTVVPFAAANYRLTDDLAWLKWKSNVYWTLAAGVNPNTVTADFATGFSFSWRAAMLSALCHWGHETRLTDGFADGQKLGVGFSGSTLPTESHWVKSFALGISVRVPALTGR